MSSVSDYEKVLIWVLSLSPNLINVRSLHIGLLKLFNKKRKSFQFPPNLLENIVL